MDQEIVPWKHGKDFCDERTGICIRANLRELPPKFPGSIPLTQYSWELIRKSNDRFVKFFPTLFNVELAVVSIEPFETNVFLNLMNQYEEWAQAQKQAREDLISERKIEREMRQVNYGKKEALPGLKRLGKMGR